MKPGYYGTWGGAFIPEVLHETFRELTAAFDQAQADPGFWKEYVRLMSTYSCRPTPLTFAENLTRHFGGARIFIKREDLNHTGAHKANNVMGQGLLVRRMGKTRVIAETGAGQHGVATATMAAKFGLRCTIYMGAEDVERQRPNVFWMEKLGAEVVPVTAGSRTLKDAINEAFRDWVGRMDDTHYVMGTVCGPHPFPAMVAWFQSIIGSEARRQSLAQTGRFPRGSTPASGAVRTRWGSSRDFSTPRRLRSSASRPAAGASRRGCTLRALPAATALPVLRRATRRCSCRPPTARCATRTRWPPVSITSGFRR